MVSLTVVVIPPYFRGVPNERVVGGGGGGDGGRGAQVVTYPTHTGKALFTTVSSDLQRILKRGDYT